MPRSVSALESSSAEADANEVVRPHVGMYTGTHDGDEMLRELEAEALEEGANSKCLIKSCVECVRDGKIAIVEITTNTLLYCHSDDNCVKEKERR